jgi:hypothetical protein
MSIDVVKKIISVNDINNGSVVTDIQMGGGYTSINPPVNDIGDISSIENLYTERFDDIDYYGVSTGAGGGSGITQTSLKIWLKADALVGLSDGDPLATWADSSNSSINATQSTTSKKPTYKTGVVNGKPIVRFDGVDDFMSTASMSLSSHFTAFFVGSAEKGSPVYVEHGSNADSSDGMRVSGNGGLGNLNGFVVNRSGAHAANISYGWLGQTVFKIASFKYDGSHTIKMNGASVSAGTVTGSTISDSKASNTLYIGAKNGTSSQMTGDIAEIVIYDTVLSDYKIISIEDELATKYGITLS